MILNVKGHEVEVYDNSQNIPILRFQKLNKYTMMQNEIGSTFADYDARTAKTLQFLQKKMVPEAIAELVNQRQTVFNSYNEYSPHGKAFAALVKSIDGKQYDGISSGDLDEILEHLNKIGLSYHDSVEKLIELKKNLVGT